MRKYLLEIVVFVCGAEVMILEMVGSRVLAPYLGTSLFVWTSLIGVILACLSLGYWQGGSLADKKGDYKTLSLIILIASVSVGLLSLFKEIVLIVLQQKFADPRISAVAATAVLFGPSSLLLGMVIPFASKLKLKNLEKSGTTVGSLYAISTAGSICGTFLAGFFLISFFGTTRILALIALSLALLALLIHLSRLSLKLLILILWVANTLNQPDVAATSGFTDVDTNYNRVWVIDSADPQTRRTVRTMRINNESSSAVFLDRPDLVYDYTKFYRLVGHFYPQVKKALMIGGGGYSYPKDFLNRFPQASLSVVEIDPQVTTLAERYFGLKTDSRLTIYHEDGRTFINHNRQKYGAVLVDAYRSATVPFQLTTLEAVQKIYDFLDDDGVVLVNLISAIEGREGRFLRSEIATYRWFFPTVLIFPVQYPTEAETVQNITLVALKSPQSPSFSSPDKELNDYLKNLWTKEVPTDVAVLSDDFAPVELYQSYRR